MMRNAPKRFEQTKVANEESASNMLGGTRMQWIICSAIPNWQLSTVSQFLPRSSQISAITLQIKSPYPFVWILRWHSWGEDLYLTLHTPALGTEPQMCTHMHAHLGVRVKWMDGAHTSPNSLFRAVNSQLPICNSQIPIISPKLDSRVSVESFNRGFRIKGYHPKVQS